MDKKGVTIHTGVDGLVDLVNSKGRIAFKDAAKLLGVSITTIEEWAHFLSEEKVIDVEYNLHNPMLIRLELTNEQKTQLKSDLEKDRTIFHTRLSTVTTYFDQLDQQVARVSKIVENVDNHLEHQIDDIKDELQVLHSLEQQKISMQEQLLESKKRVDSKLHEIDKHLADERIRYKEFEAQERRALGSEAKMFEEANAYLARVRRDEEELEKRLAETKRMSAEIEKSIAIYSKGVTDGERRILEVKQKHDRLVKDLEDEYKTINDLLKKSDETERVLKLKIEETTQKIMRHELALKTKTTSIQDLPSALQELLKNKDKLHDLINSIRHDELEIQRDLQQLHEKSKVVEYKLGSVEYNKYVAELNQKLEELVKKRGTFEEKIKSLLGMISWAKK